MFDFIAENPWVSLGILILVAVVCFQIWLQSGVKYWGWASILSVLLGVALFYVGTNIETERESVQAMLSKAANALENNRSDEIFPLLYKNPTERVLSAKEWVKSSEFSVAEIKRIHDIELAGPKSGRRAKVRMNVYCEGRLGRFRIRAPRYVELTLYRVDSEWKVYDFMQSEPMAGFREQLDASDF